MGIFINALFTLSLSLSLAAPLMAGPDDTSFGQLFSRDATAPAAPLPLPPVPEAQRSDECVELPSIGCYYSGAPAGAAVRLLIYYRGWVTDANYPGGGLYGGHIRGRVDILRSSRAALSFYKLKQLAMGKRIAVLVTGSSDISVKRTDVDRLQAGLGVTFGSVSVAAHSGGYVGLSSSIDTFSRLDKIILLDPFYADFSARIGAQVRQGAACTGFYTPHNAARYKQFFSGAGCRAEARTSPDDHEHYVPSSLLKSF